MNIEKRGGMALGRLLPHLALQHGVRDGGWELHAAARLLLHFRHEMLYNALASRAHVLKRSPDYIISMLSFETKTRFHSQDMGLLLYS